MKKQFKPTKSMTKAAQRGLDLHKEGNPAGTPRALDVGKKIASGQALSDEHVNDMAHFHASHECPGDCEDLLWGGEAGSIWSKSNQLHTMDDGFSETLGELSEKDGELAFEVFADVQEPVSLGADDKGLIWAPILRSGMLATRPGPNGEKINEPLIFTAGHSKDQLKEIGLEDIVDAFNDKALEYVTIPESHANDTIENTGFIKELKILDSKKNPGEKVLMGGHDFTEPEIKGKIERGTIASRSCGLLYNYMNTTTGKVYPVALEHTALTNKPWVGGLASYGVQGGDFSDMTIVPMMLSEKSISVEPIIPSQPSKTSQETNEETTTEDKVPASEFLADIQWGSAPSYRDIERRIESSLSQMASNTDHYPRYYLADLTDGKALVKVEYGMDMGHDAWVAPYTVDKDSCNLAPFSDWTDVSQKWVKNDDELSEDKTSLDKTPSKDEGTNINTSDDPIKVASARRKESINNPIGGRMNSLLMSEDQMEKLSLSDEAKELVRKQNQKIEKQSEELAESNKDKREASVKSKITELSDKGLKQFAPFLKEIEKTMLGDDGDIAFELQLSDGGHEVKVPETATQLCERLLKALPVDEKGIFNFSDQADLTENPIKDRPPLEAKDEDKDGKINTGAELAEMWAKADPTLANDPTIKKVLALSSDNGKGQ